MNDTISSMARALDYRGRATRQRKVRVIEIDDREDRDGITKLILEGLGYTVLGRRLPLGDYAWDSRLGRVVVERKTPADLKSSAIEGRLLDQLTRLRRARGVLRGGAEGSAADDGEITGDSLVNRGNQGGAGVFPILLIDHRPSREDPWGDADLDNVLVSVCGRVRVARCGIGQLAHRLDSLFKWSNKSSHGFLDTEV